MDTLKLKDLLEKMNEGKPAYKHRRDVENLADIVDILSKKESLELMDEVILLHATRQILNLPGADSKFDYSPLHAQAAKFGLSLSAVCAATGISNSVRKLINSGEAIHMNHLSKIALLLECEVGDLFKQIPVIEYQRKERKGASIMENAKLYSFILDQMLAVVPEDSEKVEFNLSSIRLSEDFDDLDAIRNVLELPKFKSKKTFRN